MVWDRRGTETDWSQRRETVKTNKKCGYIKQDRYDTERKYGAEMCSKLLSVKIFIWKYLILHFIFNRQINQRVTVLNINFYTCINEVPSAATVFPQIFYWETYFFQNFEYPVNLVSYRPVIKCSHNYFSFSTFFIIQRFPWIRHKDM